MEDLNLKKHNLKFRSTLLLSQHENWSQIMFDTLSRWMETDVFMDVNNKIRIKSIQISIIEQLMHIEWSYEVEYQYP